MVFGAPRMARSMAEKILLPLTSVSTLFPGMLLKPNNAPHRRLELAVGGSEMVRQWLLKIPPFRQHIRHHQVGENTHRRRYGRQDERMFEKCHQAPQPSSLSAGGQGRSSA